MSHDSGCNSLLISVLCLTVKSFLFFFIATAATEIYTLSLHDALPISLLETGCPTLTPGSSPSPVLEFIQRARAQRAARSEEHTSELQSRLHLVCRLLLEKKKNFIELKKVISSHTLLHLLKLDTYIQNS